MTDEELHLHRLFAAPERGPDETFVRQVADQVALEQGLRRAAVAGWRQCAFESAANLGLVAALASVAAAVGPVGASPLQGPGPATLLMLIFFVWLVATHRSGSSHAGG